MMSATPTTADPVSIVQQLDADAISDRIQQLDYERDALCVLLRAAKRLRKKPAQEAIATAKKGGDDAR